MKKISFYSTVILLLLFVICCKRDPLIVPPKPDPDPDPEKPVTVKEGLSWSPEAADADKELTITFKAASGTPLYGHDGDVYVHIGLISEGTWLFVPAEWNQNTAKCKMSKVEGSDFTWSIKLSPSIRQWFGSGETPVNKIGLVFRNADGTKKGREADFFIENITDGKFKAFEPAAAKLAAMPAGLKEGINTAENGTVTLVLYDKDRNGARKEFAHVVGLPKIGRASCRERV